VSDYGTMQARIASELRRNNLTDQIKNAIHSAILLAETDRFYFNEARAYTTTSNGKAYYAVPSNFQAMESLTCTRNSYKYALEPRTFQYLDSIDPGTNNTGAPAEYCVYNQQFRLWPVPDDEYTLELAFQKKLGDLTNDTDTNAWMVDGEILIRCRAKAIVLRDVIRGQAADAEADRADQVSERARNYLVRETNRRVRTGRLMPCGY
jgi:hypothetical protein